MRKLLKSILLFVTAYAGTIIAHGQTVNPVAGDGIGDNATLAFKGVDAFDITFTYSGSTSKEVTDSNFLSKVEMTEMIVASLKENAIKHRIYNGSDATSTNPETMKQWKDFLQLNTLGLTAVFTIVKSGENYTYMFNLRVTDAVQLKRNPSINYVSAVIWDRHSISTGTKEEMKDKMKLTLNAFMTQLCRSFLASNKK